MSYKVSPQIKEKTIKSMEYELNSKSSNKPKYLAIASLCLAMMCILVVNQYNYTEVQLLTSDNFDFHSENTSSEVVELYKNEYEMHLAKIKEHDINYDDSHYNDIFYDTLSLEEIEELKISSAKDYYDYLISYEQEISNKHKFEEDFDLLQEKFNSMELTNPLKEWDYISLPYVERLYDLYGMKTYHMAYDIPADMSTPIYAIGEGVVTIAEWSGSYGMLIEIDHGEGVISRYAHCIMDSPQIKVGDIVQAGQQIAAVGTTGASTGPHLHFETRYYDTAFDIRLFDFNDENLFNFE